MRESRTPCNAAAFHRTTTLSLALVWPITPSGQIRTPRVSKHRKYEGSLDVDVDSMGMLAAIGTLPPAIVDHRIDANHLFSLRIDSPTVSGVPIPARRVSYTARLSVRGGGFSTSGEESAVALVTNLREV